MNYSNEGLLLIVFCNEKDVHNTNTLRSQIQGEPQKKGRLEFFLSVEKKNYVRNLHIYLFLVVGKNSHYERYVISSKNIKSYLLRQFEPWEVYRG